jgi:hypothetical protein
VTNELALDKPAQGLLEVVVSEHEAVNRLPAEKGTLYVASFSGFVLANSKDLQDISLELDGCSVLIMKPVRIAPATWRPIPPLDMAGLEKIAPGAPELNFHRMVSLPKTNEDGSPGVHLVWGDEIDVSDYVDTFKIHLIDRLGRDDDAQGEIVEGIQRRILAWLRVIAYQWWAGRSIEQMNGNTHMSIGSSIHGESLSLTGPIKFISRAGIVDFPFKNVDQAIWSEACLKAGSGHLPSETDMLTSEAIYQAFTKNFGLSVIMMCSVFEI